MEQINCVKYINQHLERETQDENHLREQNKDKREEQEMENHSQQDEGKKCMSPELEKQGRDPTTEDQVESKAENLKRLLQILQVQ